MKVDFLGDAATRCIARPLCRLAALQLLAIGRLTCRRALPGSKYDARYTPSNCRF